MGKREPDASMERLLREALSARDRAPQSECLDPETLAAWSEGALTGSERTFAEAHAARCGRCQAMLAAMARVAPEPPNAAVSPLRKWIGMLTPAAAAAAAVALWFLVEPRQTAPPAAPVATVAERPAASAPDASQPAAPAPSSSDRVAAPPTTTNERSRKRVEEGVKDNAQASAKASPSKVEADRALAARAAEPQDRRDVAAPPPLKGEMRAAPQPQRAPAPPPPSVQSAGATSQQTADQVARATAELKGQVGQLADAAARQEPARGGARLNFAAPGFIVAVPSSAVQWRVTAGRIVEHSLDAGATWVTQYTAPEPTMLLAGAATSPATAWLVGRAGTILHTADGRTWQRIRFPESVDLLSVAAVDSRTAAVMTADKRTFSTTDSGATWIERKD